MNDLLTRTLFLAWGLAACSSAQSPTPVTEPPNAPPATEDDTEQFSTNMNRMGSIVSELRFLANPPGDDPVDHKAVIAQMDILVGMAKNLSDLHLRKTPALAPEDMLAFIQEVDYARQVADADPPNYSVVKGIGNSCITCHGTRPCPGREDLICPDVPIY